MLPSQIQALENFFQGQICPISKYHNLIKHVKRDFQLIDNATNESEIGHEFFSFQTPVRWHQTL